MRVLSQCDFMVEECGCMRTVLLEGRRRTVVCGGAREVFASAIWFLMREKTAKLIHKFGGSHG